MHIPGFVHRLFPSFTWHIPAERNTLFLTFDDGPHPEITPRILSLLKEHKAKATFFCIGENISRYPDVYRKILEEGHATGNHTQHHLNGWRTSGKEYLEDVKLCDDEMKTVALNRETISLFRPPYGRIKPSQTAALKATHSIILWDVLSRDYNQSLTGKQCVRNVTAHARSGSIVVFHDSDKARDRVLNALPAVLDYFSKKKFLFEKIT